MSSVQQSVAFNQQIGNIMRSIFTLALVALLSAFFQPAYADELIVHTLSIHANNNNSETRTSEQDMPDGSHVSSIWKTKPYNNNNFGLGYRWDNGVEVGAYYNSFNKVSAYAAKYIMFNDNIGAFVGAATGYNEGLGKAIIPLAGIVFKAQVSETAGIALELMPPVGKHVGVAHLSISFKLD